MRALTHFWKFIGLVIGAAIGTFAFFVLCSIWLGTPIRDSLASAHGILIATSKTPLAPHQQRLLIDLVERGALISSTDLLTNMASFYATLVQVLIALFVIFGFISFLAVQTHSRRHIEDTTDQVVQKSSRGYFSSIEFEDRVEEKIDQTLQIEMETYQERLEAVETLAEKVAAIEERLAQQTPGNQQQGAEQE